MKIFFFASQAVILYLISFKYKPTLANLIDTFPISLLLVPSAILAIIWPLDTTAWRKISMLWTFSHFLESVAILPQLLIIRRIKKADTITANYLILLGLYRFFYVLNWFLRILVYGQSVALQVILSGILQTLLYVDVFYIYFTKVVRGEKFTLPT